ncbi:hypothetical protein FNV60_28735 [Streptomyces sp. RLB3-5]|nr:hypothetical protein FNV60_28735 [Streptomyces sp. RLB3-5]QDO61934.1 hypothetical protein FNV59_30980 [Streptomyces sp. RLB1-8]
MTCANGLTHGLLVAGKQPVGHRRRRAPRVRVDHDAVGRGHPVCDIAPARLQGGDQKLTFAPRAVDDDQLATGVAGDHGVPGPTLGQDRILDEARQTADPVPLMRVFGIAAETAMKYIHTAYPERRSTLWR